MAVSAWVPSGALGSMMQGGDAFRENRGAPRVAPHGTPGARKTLDDARAEVEVIGEAPGDRPILPSTRARACWSSRRTGRGQTRACRTSCRCSPRCSRAMVGARALHRVRQRREPDALARDRAAARPRDPLGPRREPLPARSASRSMEGLVLAVLAGVVGLLLARWAGQALRGSRRRATSRSTRITRGTGASTRSPSSSRRSPGSPPVSGPRGRPRASISSSR